MGRHVSQAKRAIPADAPGADLWDRPPGKLLSCAGCGQTAEAYTGRFCFLCVCSGQMAFVLAGPTVTREDRRRLSAGPGAG